MSDVNGEILVIAPHATRTGSTKVLIELLSRLPSDLASRIVIRTLTGGPWLPRLQALGTPPSGRPPLAVLINSALAAGEVPATATGIPAAVYVHETGEVLAALSEAALNGLRRARLVLCVSEAVQAAGRFSTIEERMETEAVDVALAVARKLCAELIAAPTPVSSWVWARRNG